MEIVFALILLIGLAVCLVTVHKLIWNNCEKHKEECTHDWIRGSYAHNQEETADYVKCSICGKRFNELSSGTAICSPGSYNNGFRELWKKARDKDAN